MPDTTARYAAYIFVRAPSNQMRLFAGKFRKAHVTLGALVEALKIMASSEIRCPIHGFIELDELERALVKTEAFQRLRHIHQLAMTYLVYPGATHSRFEHMLGAMHSWR